MNLAQVARILAGFALFFALIQASLLVVAVFESGSDPRFDPVNGFGWGAGAGLVTAFGLSIVGRNAAPEFFRREGLAVVGLAWCIAIVLGAIPLYVSNGIATWSDALFESTSGLTTTGATVLGSGLNPAIEDLPNSLLIWRSLTQWLGGLGIIFVFIVLLPAMGVTGKNLLASEQVGVANEDLRPSMRLQARSLFRLYIGLTASCALLLWLHGKWSGGHNGVDAICQAFSTIASGGFHTKNYSVGQFESVTVEVITIVFMFLAGANFALLISAISGHRAKRLFGNPEFKLYAGLTIGLIIAVTITLRIAGGHVIDHAVVHRDYDEIGRCLRDAAFQVVSLLTSTGFGTADYQNWPKAALLLLLFAMFVGGCSGSTAGGFKILRLLVVVKLMTFSIRRFIRPKSVEKLKVADDVVPNSVISAILGLFVLWLATVAAGTIVLSFESRLDLASSFTTSLSMCSCTGPSMTEVIEFAPGEYRPAIDLDVGPYGGYGDLHTWTKLFMCALMTLGRLEILAPLVLFAPGIWRR